MLPLIKAHLAEGPSADQKQAPVKAISDAVVATLGISVHSVRVPITLTAEDDYMAAGVSLRDRRAAERASALQAAVG
jgi:4-oxalocrotonate tautomerase family enzyme